MLSRSPAATLTMSVAEAVAGPPARCRMRKSPPIATAAMPTKATPVRLNLALPSSGIT